MYGDWFQFVQRPFGTAPDGKVYFPSHGIEAARSAMTRCIERGGGPGLVIGATGVGKTTLAMKLIDQFRAAVPVAYLSGRGIVSRRELLQTVLFELGRPYGHDEGELRLELIDVLTSTDASRARTLLVFDDADQFSSELLTEVSAVSNLARDGFWSTDVVLLGTVRLEEALASPSLISLANRIAARYYLHPLGFEETEAYVKFQIQQIAGGTREIFTGDAITEILETSGGVSRTINQLCDHALVLAVSHGLKYVDAEGVKEAWLDLQQLPPADDSHDSRNQEPTESFIEFGALDDGSQGNGSQDDGFQHKRSLDEGSGAPPDSASDHQPTSVAECGDERRGNVNAAEGLFEVGAQTQLFPDVTLDTIERQVAEIVEVQPRRAEDGDQFGDARSASLAGNPFLEAFDQEEVVLDLPLGMYAACGPAVAQATTATAEPPVTDDELLQEVLRQMGELEHRSLMLSESLTSAQEDLEAAKTFAGVGDVMQRQFVAESLCGGGTPNSSVSDDLYEPWSADPGQPVDSSPPAGGKNSPREEEFMPDPSLVQTIDTVSEVQVSAVDEVLPSESIDCVSPATVVEPDVEEHAESVEPIGETHVADEPLVERVETEDSAKDHTEDHGDARHDAQAGPPPSTRPRFRRLFVNLRNQ